MEGAVEQTEIQMVTMEVKLHGRPEFDLLSQLRQRDQHCAIVLLTRVGTTKIAVKALKQGAWGYLVKPVDPDEFIFQVIGAMERRLLIENDDYTRHLQDKIQQQVNVIQNAYEETIYRLVTASRYRDEETGAHIHRTGLCSAILAEAAGWPKEKVQQISMAAPMHDIGKIGIPDAILRKPSALTSQETEIMRLHASIGAGMLLGSNSPILQMAEVIARCHHERWDGQGYPAGLSERDIPESARVVAIVDVYDALTHDHVYRPAMSEQEALDVIRPGRGTHFDPDLLDLFFEQLVAIRGVTLQHPDVPKDDANFCLAEGNMADADQPMEMTQLLTPITHAADGL